MNEGITFLSLVLFYKGVSCPLAETFFFFFVKLQSKELLCHFEFKREIPYFSHYHHYLPAPGMALVANYI
jgi:hypothetical protein